MVTRVHCCILSGTVVLTDRSSSSICFKYVVCVLLKLFTVATFPVDFHVSLKHLLQSTNLINNTNDPNSNLVVLFLWRPCIVPRSSCCSVDCLQFYFVFFTFNVIFFGLAGLRAFSYKRQYDMLLNLSFRVRALR